MPATCLTRQTCLIVRLRQTVQCNLLLCQVPSFVIFNMADNLTTQLRDLVLGSSSNTSKVSFNTPPRQDQPCQIMDFAGLL